MECSQLTTDSINDAGHAEVQSQVAVDMVLRLWALWSTTGQAEKLQDWVTSLTRDADKPPSASSPLVQLGEQSHLQPKAVAMSGAMLLHR